MTPLRCNYQAAAAARSSRNEHDAAVLSHRIGILQFYRGLYDEAREAVEEALAIYRSLDSESNIAVALHWLGVFAQARREFAEARRLYNESLDISRKLGEQRGIRIPPCMSWAGSPRIRAS